jgi:hypothetical protein
VFLVPARKVGEVTYLIDKATHFLEEQLSIKTPKTRSDMILWLAYVNIEHAILSLKLRCGSTRTTYSLSNKRSNYKKRKNAILTKETFSKSYTIEDCVNQVNLRLTNIKITSDNYEASLLELRACRDLLVKAIESYF